MMNNWIAVPIWPTVIIIWRVYVPVLDGLSWSFPTKLLPDFLPRPRSPRHLQFSFRQNRNRLTPEKSKPIKIDRMRHNYHNKIIHDCIHVRGAVTQLVSMVLLRYWVTRRRNPWLESWLGPPTVGNLRGSWCFRCATPKNSYKKYTVCIYSI